MSFGLHRAHHELCIGSTRNNKSSASWHSDNAPNQATKVRSETSGQCVPTRRLETTKAMTFGYTMATVYIDVVEILVRWGNGRAEEEILTRLIANPAGRFNPYFRADPRLRYDRCDPGKGRTTGTVPMVGSLVRPPLPASRPQTDRDITEHGAYPQGTPASPPWLKVHGQSCMSLLYLQGIKTIWRTDLFRYGRPLKAGKFLQFHIQNNGQLISHEMFQVSIDGIVREMHQSSIHHQTIIA